MGAFYEDIPDNIYEWILKQRMLWVATAPLSAKGHINVSPKGGKYFGLVNKSTFWYMDLSGSGCETISHLRENGRITVMFNAFECAPRIVRLWGYGRILERHSAAFDRFVAEQSIQTIDATRSIIIVDVHQVGSSCGYSVPFYEFKDFRQTLNQVFEKKKANFESGKSIESPDRYWAYKNAWSIDGLPAVQRGLECATKEGVEPIVKFVGKWAPVAPHGPKSFKLSAQLRHQLVMFRTTRVQLTSVLLMVLSAFFVGIGVAYYGPIFAESQRGRFSTLLL